ncbi:MAG TPA: flagellar basal body P-ring protein FlgI [Steroidobacteraceae bacterium]|nr:flagellar basal body P-ring protein FlgI [Steroidobacteraceae bacterium]
MRYLGVLFLALCALQANAAVRIKDLGRFDGVRENVVIGYGLVVGLSGTGDSRRSFATVQSVSNMLQEFGLQVPPEAVNSRNVAAVLVTANVPGFLSVGDRMDVNVSSIGDASSLAGGTLLMTPLKGTDRDVYAVAQGALSIGGFRFEQSGTVRQKNHPTSGNIPEGAIAEKAITPQLVAKDGSLDLILNEPDFTTAMRVANAINGGIRGARATPIAAGRVRLAATNDSPANVVSLIASIESLAVEPDSRARVVVNERTGTIVSGGDVWLSEVTVSQGDIKVSIDQRYLVSQPQGVFVRPSREIETAVVPEATISATESDLKAVNLPQGATISDLIAALKGIRASSRDVIAILQGIKRAGALHAELIIQ